MKTVVAETVLLGEEAFSTLGETVVIPDREIRREHLTDADLLIVRSKTKITPELLEGSGVRFVGTATAGFEHIDTRYLEERNIGWTASPGCNADSVAEYIMTALLHLYRHRGLALEGKTLGIIGVGQVGSRVASRAEALGLRPLLNDPPRAQQEGPSGFCELDDLLLQSDIVTLHTPLVTDPPWPTRGMADCRFFKRMKPESVFINAARGKVLDTDALLFALEKGLIEHAVLDVWDPEPEIRLDALDRAEIGTPHIAGHSLEGKLNGTIQCFRQACRSLEIDAQWDPSPHLPAPAVPRLQIDCAGKTDLEVLAEAAGAVYQIKKDDDALRSAAVGDAAQRAKNFDKLRAQYEGRREFFNTEVSLKNSRTAVAAKLKRLGFALPPGGEPDNG